MGNIHVKLFEIWTSGSRDVVQSKSLRKDGRRTKTDHNSSPRAFGSGELNQFQNGHIKHVWSKAAVKQS